MKSVTTATAAAAIGISRKRLDNILAREARPLLPTGRHGVARRVSVEVVEVVALGMVLSRDLGSTISASLVIAGRLLRTANDGTNGTIPIGSLGRLTFDVDEFRRVIEESVSESIEQSPLPRRGRPPTR